MTRSVISVPITVNVDAIRSELLNDLAGKPVFQGHSPELGARLLAEERSIFQEPKKIIDVPFRAAKCTVKKVPRQVTKTIKVGVESFKCWVRPWKWGHCVKDVFKDVVETVWDDVTECLPEQVAVVRTVYTPIQKITEKIVDTSVVVNYRGDLSDLALQVTGDTITTHLALDVPVSVDVKAGVLGSNLTAKGVLACNSRVEVDGSVKFSLVQEGEHVVFKAEADRLEPDLKKFCIPGAVELAEVWSFSNVEAFALRRLVSRQLEKQLEIAVNKALKKQADQHPVDGLLVDVAGQLDAPVQLAKGLWLDVVPVKVTLSQIQGRVDEGGQTISMTAGLHTDLSVHYGEKPNHRRAGRISVGLGSGGDAFRLAPRARASLQKLRDIVATVLEREGGSQLKDAGFALAGVDVYQSGKRIVLAVSIQGKKLFRPSGTLYLSGEPKYDAGRGVVYLDDLGFTVETRNWLAHNVATVLHDKITNTLAKEAVVRLDEPLDRFLSQHRDFRVPVANGALLGRIDTVRLTDFWVDGNALNLDLVLTGMSQLQVAL